MGTLPQLLEADIAALDAALVSKLIGKPVRLQYMRQDATAWDPKGPAAVYRGRAALDAQGNVIAYDFFAKGFSRQDVIQTENDPKDTLAGQFTGAPTAASLTLCNTTYAATSYSAAVLGTVTFTHNVYANPLLPNALVTTFDSCAGLHYVGDATHKVRGVRAAMCTDRTLARYAREHNGANVLALGATLLSDAEAEEIVTTFLTTPMREARYVRRLVKVQELERRG